MLPVGPRLVAAVSRRGQHRVLFSGSDCRHFASQSAAANEPAGARERAELPEHLQSIVNDYDLQRAREAEKAAKRFPFLSRLLENRYAGLFGMALAGSIAFGVATFDDAASGVHEVTALLLRRLEPERARRFFVGAAAWGLMPRDYDKDDPYLVIEPIAGLRFTTPVGLASGFDREARAPNAFFNLGFGFVEVGPIFSDCNEADARMRAARARLAARDRTGQVVSMGRLGVTIGGGCTAVMDLVEELGHDVDYIVVDLALVPSAECGPEGLRKLVAGTVRAASDWGDTSPPVFLRVPAAYPHAEIAAIATTAIEGGAKGLILASSSGVKHSSMQAMLTTAYSATNGRLVLVADGVTSGIEALECIESGATLVQISSLLLTEGPGACRRIKSELATVLFQNHYTCLKEAIGSAHRPRQRGGRKKNLWRARD